MIYAKVMIFFVVISSIIAAFLFAWSTVIQRYEAGDVKPEELFRRDFIKRLSKNKKWLAAFGLQVLGFLFQAAALRNGSLILVQPIMTIDLIFLLLILHFNKKLAIGRREILAIFMICLGISGALIFAQPKNSNLPFNRLSLFVSVSFIALIILIAIFIIRRTSSARQRAFISAVAAGFSFAVGDVLTKIVSHVVTNGISYLFLHWQIWALLISGIVSIIMTQNTYGAGPIVISQPTMEVVEPVISVVLGIYIFQDSVNLSIGNIVVSLVSALVAIIGIIALTRSNRLITQTS